MAINIINQCPIKNRTEEIVERERTEDGDGWKR